MDMQTEQDGRKHYVVRVRDNFTGIHTADVAYIDRVMKDLTKFFSERSINICHHNHSEISAILDDEQRDDLGSTVRNIDVSQIQQHEAAELRAKAARMQYCV